MADGSDGAGETKAAGPWQSDWMAVTQDMIDQFADLTEDWNAIHVDADAARAAGLPGPIAHGFLLLSLLAAMFADSGHPLADADGGLNYGFDSLRFIGPVVAGSRVRARFADVGHESVAAGKRLTLDVTMEREGEERPALVGRWVLLLRG